MNNETTENQPFDNTAPAARTLQLVRAGSSSLVCLPMHCDDRRLA